MDEYEELANKRAEALVKSMQQTIANIRQRMKEKNPDTPDWILDLILAFAIYNVGKELGGFNDPAR